ncbi:methionine ABC transporter ATP-binding protein [Lachnospiraceae bacterium LCP25S3_G4]
MSEDRCIIELKQLHKEFNTSSGVVKALEDINIQVKEGEIFGIIGLSGAGKSTLIRCVNFLEEPTSGEVIFDGNHLSELSGAKLRKVRQSMGMIFQQFQLLNQRNVLQNICFPLEIAGVSKKEAKKRAQELLELVDLKDKAKAYPAQLSGGQKQRVAIARALATSPKVLLCDEATSALDPNTTKSILALLKKLRKTLGITIIIITHEMEVISSTCDKVAIIDGGRIAETGKVAEVFLSPKSKIGRQLILGDAIDDVTFETNRYFRITFDGRLACEPVLSKIILATKAPLNIAFASTKNVNDMAVGQMVLQLPNDEEQAKAILHYMKVEGIQYEEVKQNEF